MSNRDAAPGGLWIVLWLVVFVASVMVVGGMQSSKPMTADERDEILRYEVCVERAKRDREIRKAIIRKSRAY